MYDVVTLGSNTLDIFAHTDRTQIIDISDGVKDQEFISYPVGAKILITKLMHNFGGNGANCAVSFARLGLKTGYIGKVGRDETGRQILANLKANKVDFLGARGDESGLSVVLDAREEDRTILTFKGCNNDLRYSEIRKPKAEWLYVSSMLGASLDTTLKIVEEHKGMLAFNPSATMLGNMMQEALKIVRKAQVLVLNKEEAESIVGPGTDVLLARKLQKMGPQIVAITDGRRGAIALHGPKTYRIRPKPSLKIAETTGAGDAFASTLLAGMILGKKFETCLKMAINNAESVLQGHGAQNVLLAKPKLLALVSKDRREVGKA